MVFDYMAFMECGDGSITDIVGVKKLFKDKEDFADFALNEYDCFEEKPTADMVEVDYIRYYPHMPEGFQIDSGYTFCKKGKGAIEVYRIRRR